MFPQLQTERFLLTEILPQDQTFIFEGLSHPQVIPFYGVRYESFDATKAQMDWYAGLWKEGTGIPWMIKEKQSGESAGVVCMYYFKAEHQKAEIGFWLLPSFWGRGIMSEVLSVAIPYLHNEKNIHRLEAFVEEGNAASCRVMERAGFLYEGTMKDCEIKDGKFISLLIYASLATRSIS